MWEVKSKKSGKIDILSDDDYKSLVTDGNIDLSRFVCTELRKTTIIPSLKEVPKEVKITKPKK